MNSERKTGEKEDSIMSVDVSEVTENQVATTQEDKDRETIALTVPVELKDIVDKRAETEGFSTAAYVRNLLARENNYVIPEDFGSKKKYATDEERKAAVAANAKKRNAMVKKLMAAYRAGKIDIESLMALQETDDEDTDETQNV